jgi:hypothetical protein
MFLAVYAAQATILLIKAVILTVKKYFTAQALTTTHRHATAIQVIIGHREFVQGIAPTYQTLTIPTSRIWGRVSANLNICGKIVSV